MTKCDNLQIRLSNILQETSSTTEGDPELNIESLIENLELLSSILQNKLKKIVLLSHQVKIFKECVERLLLIMSEFNNMLEDGAYGLESDILKVIHCN